MSAATLLREVSEAGFNVRLVDGGLRLDYDRAPPASLIERLRAQRDDVISILSARNSLRAERDVLYACSGVTWPEDATSSPVAFSDLLVALVDRGIKFSRKGGNLVRWSMQRTPRDLIPQIASHRDAIMVAIGDWVIDEPNHDVAPSDSGETDHHCAFGLMATYAVFDPAEPEFQRRWVCDACFASGAPHQLPPTRTRKTAATSPVVDPSTRMRPVPRPNEEARDQWWSKPVQGWGSGWFVIHNMAADQTVKIEIRKDPCDER